MKSIILGSLLTAISVSPAFADAWAFDSKEKVVDFKVGGVLIEKQETQPSWTFCEADATYLVKEYDSHAFE